jgi:hypothetical protein
VRLPGWKQQYLIFKNMKTPFLISSVFGLVLGLLATTPAVYAQDAAPATPPAGKAWGGARPMEQLAKKLNLTDEQKTKVAAILKDQMTQMLELRKNEDLSQDDRRTQMMAIRKEGNAKIRALLTSEQQTTFDKLPPMGGGPRGKKKSDGEAPAPAAPPTT